MVQFIIYNAVSAGFVFDFGHVKKHVTTYLSRPIFHYRNYILQVRLFLVFINYILISD